MWCLSNSASPNFSYNISWAADVSGTDTDMFSASQVVTGTDATSTGELDTPNTNSIPPNVWIWLVIDDRTAVPAKGASWTIKGHEF